MLLTANVGVAKDGDEVTYQAIITDCGTVYQIPAGCSVDLACKLLDYYTKIDCGGISGGEEAVMINIINNRSCSAAYCRLSKCEMEVYHTSLA
ncbi:hypothetical protein HMPREF1981_00035 [Bacteroides pyogenes F0041]|uniref:Uncharacterized protein n=1 Tax=Bacteroides pyogenes F0041 TaxID=1321819 RepID=U2CXH2_9BACE|nr:hypothetical protein HMPREF1981_00035 [Bacteroides pyogenes F0041]